MKKILLMLISLFILFGFRAKDLPEENEYVENILLNNNKGDSFLNDFTEDDFYSLQSQAIVINVNGDDDYSFINTIVVGKSYEEQDVLAFYELMMNAFPKQLEHELYLSENNELIAKYSNLNGEELQQVLNLVFGTYINIDFVEASKEDNILNTTISIRNSFIIDRYDELFDENTILIDISKYKVTSALNNFNEKIFAIADGVYEVNEPLYFTVKEKSRLTQVQDYFLIIVALVAILVAIFAYILFKNKTKNKKVQDNLEDEADIALNSNNEEYIIENVEKEEESLIKFKKLNKKELQKLAFSPQAFIYSLLVLMIFALIALIFAFEINSKLQMTSLSENIGSFLMIKEYLGTGFDNIIRFFLNVITLISSNSLTLVTTVSSTEASRVLSSVTFNISFALIILLVTTLSHVIGKIIIKDQKPEDRLIFSLSGIVYASIGLVIINSIKIKYMPTELFNFSSQSYVIGSALKVLLMTFPTMLLTTYYLNTKKDKLNSSFVKFNIVFYDVISKFIKVLVLSAAIAFIFAFVYNTNLLLLIQNLIPMSLVLVSGGGLSILGERVNLVSEALILAPSFLIVVGCFIVFVLLVVYDLNSKYRDSKLNSEVVFSLVYVSTLYFLILITSLFAEFAVKGALADVISITPNYISLFTAYILMMIIVYIRVKYFSKQVSSNKDKKVSVEVIESEESKSNKFT